MFKRMVVNARNKPKQTRDSYAFGIAIGFTAIIVMVWLYNLPSRIVSVADGVVEGTRPVANLFDQVAAVKESLPSSDDIQGTLASSSQEDKTWTTPEDYRGWSLRATSTTTVATTSAATAASTTASTTADVTAEPVRIVTVPATTTNASTSVQSP